MTTHPSQITERFSAEWLAGYRMALADVDALLEGIDGPITDSLAPSLRARLAAMLVTRQGSPRAA